MDGMTEKDGMEPADLSERPQEAGGDKSAGGPPPQRYSAKRKLNRIEADHGALKRLIRPTRGFQSMKTAYATIKGFEMMRMIRRRHCILIEPGVTGEVRFVNKLFDLAA